MNILFVVLSHVMQQKNTTNIKAWNSRIIPYGVLSIATYVKRHAKIDVGIKIIDCNLYMYEEYIQIIKDAMREFKPTIIGISMNYDNSYKYLKDVSKTIKIEMAADKEHVTNRIIVLGGTSASFSYKEIFEEQDYIDAICYTEGEIPFTALVNALADKKTCEFLENNKSWITRKSLLTHKVPERSFVTDLDSVIDVDYRLIDNIGKYRMMEAFSPFLNKNDLGKTQFFLITSRGCPYKCVFCATHSGLYGGKIRYASIDKVVSHVEHLISEYGMNVLTIYDDQLLLNRERAKELFRRLARYNLRIECPNGLSAAFIDDEIAYLMRKAGMDTIILAIEHGSEYMLNKIIHKPLKLDMVKSTINILRKYDFFIEAFFIIGIPGEEEKHRIEMVDFIRKMEFDWVGFNPATPLRGSELYDICIKNGYIDKNLKIGAIENEMRNYIINAPPHLVPKDIMRKMYLINLDINFVNNYRMKIGDYDVAIKTFQDVIERSTDHAFAYYYLSKAQKQIDNIRAFEKNYNMYIEIINRDDTWKEYATHFNLDRL